MRKTLIVLSCLIVAWILLQVFEPLVADTFHRAGFDIFLANPDGLTLVEIILSTGAILLFVPSLVFFAECVVASSRGLPEPSAAEHAPLAIAVIVPAHDEEHGVAETVRHLSGQMQRNQRLIVIADNCTDRTADEAGKAGAEVWTRSDFERRGKGYAISFALNRLASRPPDVVIVLDADCRIADGGLDRLAEAAKTFGRPVQARYLLNAPRPAESLASVSALALLVRNLVRPLAMLRLGMPCHLTGSGMAFPWDQIRSTPHQHGLVEDLVMGLELSIAGHPPRFAPHVVVESELPAGKAAAASQRRRWEHGQLSTLVTYGPRLLREAFRQRRPDLAALAADLVVPPLALLVILLFAAGLVTGPAILAGVTITPLVIIMSAIALVTVATGLAWARFGRALVPASSLLMAPAYLLWKLPMYAAFFLRRRETEWIRTPRRRKDDPCVNASASKK